MEVVVVSLLEFGVVFETERLVFALLESTEC